MRAVLQRVTRARVEVEGRIVSEIGRGVLIFLGVGVGDTDAQAEALAKKISGLRIFDDPDGRMNLALEAVGGGYLVVSQFTLYGDLSKGKRPGFEAAMRPPESERLYLLFCDRLAALSGRPVLRGEFGAMMRVELVNDGPATFVVEQNS
ncbi:MAG TPA: D-aminoacyl-tRNA deacylase [Planctomycetota bacterium]|nr:D-aminoacyl-tRNA deacylase [Planctomycetota bacterium]